MTARTQSETIEALLAAIQRAAETNKGQVALQLAEALALVRGESRDPIRGDGIGFVGAAHPDREA